MKKTLLFSLALIAAPLFFSGTAGAAPVDPKTNACVDGAPREIWGSANYGSLMDCDIIDNSNISCPVNPPNSQYACTTWRIHYQGQCLKCAGVLKKALTSSDCQQQFGGDENGTCSTTDCSSAGSGYTCTTHHTDTPVSGTCYCKKAVAPTPPTVEEQCTNYNTNCHETCKTPALGCHTETIPNTNVSCQCRGSANSGTSQSTTTTTPEHNVTGNELTAEECAELFPNSIRCSTSVCPAPVSGYTCTEHSVGSRGTCVCLDPINPNVGDDPTIISGGEQPFSQDGYAADGYGYDEITTCPTDMNTQGCCCVPKVSGQAGRFGDALVGEFYDEVVD